MSVRVALGISGLQSLIALVALAGCSLVDPPVPIPTNECSADVDCNGAVCETALGMCIAPEPEAMRVGFEVIPASDPSGEAPVRSSFVDVNISGATDSFDLDLQRRITIVGDVRWGEERVPAELTFKRQSLYAGGASLRTRANTLPEPALAGDGEMADYATGVVAGQQYEVEVRPTGDFARQLPPMHWTVDLPAEGEFGRASFMFPPELGGACGDGVFVGCSFEGRVVSLVAGADGVDEEVPQDGLQVRAVDPETGRVISSTGMTGPNADDAEDTTEAGSFTLRIAPDAGSWVLRITGDSDDSERAALPTITADPARFFPGEMPPRVRVPSVETLTYAGFVEDASGQRLENATVTLRSENVFDDASQVNGSFSVTVTTDLSDDSQPGGDFEVELLPGQYEVVITPSGSDLGVLVVDALDLSTAAAGATLMGQRFEVEARTRLGGRVQTTDGEEMAGSEIFAIARSTDSDARAGAFARSSDAVADATGRFDLPLDIGVYDLRVRPPTESGFSWVLVPNFAIGNTGTTVSVRYQVEAPVPVSGVLRDADGTPVVGATVRAFTILEADDGIPRALLMGETTSAEDGSYRVLLPPRLN